MQTLCPGETVHSEVAASTFSQLNWNASLCQKIKYYFKFNILFFNELANSVSVCVWCLVLQMLSLKYVEAYINYKLVDRSAQAS